MLTKTDKVRGNLDFSDRKMIKGFIKKARIIPMING